MIRFSIFSIVHEVLGSSIKNSSYRHLDLILLCSRPFCEYTTEIKKITCFSVCKSQLNNNNKLKEIKKLHASVFVNPQYNVCLHLSSSSYHFGSGQIHGTVSSFQNVLLEESSLIDIFQKASCFITRFPTGYQCERKESCNEVLGFLYFSVYS